MIRRSPLLLALAVSYLAVSPLPAQQLTTADSNLVYRILTAEDRRDSMAPALSEGTSHADARIRLIAERAKGRISDSLYAGRSALPAPVPRVTWPLPEWRARHDSLRFKRNDCAAMREALGDPVRQVRLRAMDLLPPTCGADSLTIAALASRAGFGHHLWTAEWHQPAHALVALARLRPDAARRYTDQHARQRIWQLRLYAARAAQLAADTALLRRLVRDRDGNVAEAAVQGLQALGGHGGDSVYLAALRSHHPQVVRAAAVALKGSTRAEVAPAAESAFRHWQKRRHDSERDARLALLDLMGRPASEDVRRPIEPLPREVVALALGRMDTLSVHLANGSTFLVRLRGDLAPITAARVLALVDDGKYRGGSWHRVIPDFVIQGGLAGANEYVGGSHFFRDELGNLSHLRGGVGMSTRGHDTGDGQWFIDLSDLPRLDRDYTLFGEVIKGMSVVDGVLEGERIIAIARGDHPIRIR